MAGIPLSKIETINDLVRQRTDLIAHASAYQRIVGVAVHFENDGTEYEPVPDAAVPQISAILIEYTTQQLAAVEAELTAAGIDPQA